MAHLNTLNKRIQSTWQSTCTWIAMQEVGRIL